MTRALLTSTTLSSPKPTSAIDPAIRPLVIATTASRLFQPIVRAVRPQAHRRRRESATSAGRRVEQPQVATQLHVVVTAIGYFSSADHRVEWLTYLRHYVGRPPGQGGCY